MQLALLILLLLVGDKAGGLNDFKPLIKSIGGEQAERALKDAEEISSVISAVQSFSQGGGTDALLGALAKKAGEEACNSTNSDSAAPPTNGGSGTSPEFFGRDVPPVNGSNGAMPDNFARNAPPADGSAEPYKEYDRGAVNFPLAPIADIADAPITAALTRYISHPVS